MSFRAPSPPTVSPQLEQACIDFRHYMRSVVRPAFDLLIRDASVREVSLHTAFGANLFVAHAVDYIHSIRRANDIREDRRELVKSIDSIVGVAGARFCNLKFELIDAINNALKHIRLDSKRYTQLEERYGSISFRSLLPESGRVLCILDGYRFDYVRVILLPAFQALNELADLSTEELLDVTCEQSNHSLTCSHEAILVEDWDDPIDVMIELCNPTCDNCGESEGECYCGEYVYAGQQGKFESRFRSEFDLNGTMARISGAYRQED